MNSHRPEDLEYFDVMMNNERSHHHIEELISVSSLVIIDIPGILA